MGTGDKYGEVSVNRNKAIQQFIDEMTEKRHTFNGTESDWHDYITHWLNIYREWSMMIAVSSIVRKVLSGNVMEQTIGYMQPYMLA